MSPLSRSAHSQVQKVCLSGEQSQPEPSLAHLTGVRHIVSGGGRDRRFRMGLYGWRKASAPLCGAITTRDDLTSISVESALAAKRHALTGHPVLVQSFDALRLCPDCLRKAVA